MQLADKTMLLTGANGGIGATIAAELAGRGARLVLSGRSRTRLENVRAALPGQGHSVLTADLEDPQAPSALVAAAGPVDCFVSAAGLPASGWLSEYRPGQLARAVRVNLEAPMQIALTLLPSLQERKHGHLLFVSSLAGKVPSPALSIYCASKFGLRGFALALRSELAGSGVGVSVVCPGFVRDEGMFAASGAALPPALGSVTAAQVAVRVAEAILDDAAKVSAAPRRHRAIAHMMHCAPRLWWRALTGREALKVAGEIAAGQVERR